MLLPLDGEMEETPEKEEPLLVEELSERISGLDKDSKSLLFLLSLSAFNEWQDAYLDAYKRLLELREKKKLPIDEYEANLYTLLSRTQKQRTIMQNHDWLPTNQTSYLRTIWRTYRVELFIKALLIIFLLKLPYFCYIVAITFYILYCFGVITHVVHVARIVREHHSTQNLYRRLQYMLSFVEPLLLAQQGTGIPGEAANVENEDSTPEEDVDAQADENTTNDKEAENVQEPTPPTYSTINVDEEKPKAAHRRRWTAVAEELERRATQESGKEDVPVATTQYVETTVTYKAPDPTDISDVNKGDTDVATDEDPTVQDTLTGGSTSSNSHAKPSKEDSKEKKKKKHKPSKTEKVLYQLFASFVLSLLPWWEPNPMYL